MLGGRVDVDDELDGIDVHTARGDVGRHEHAHTALAERLQVPITLRLRQIAVQVDGGDAVGGELLGELARLMLGTCEEDSTSRSRCELGDHGVLVGVLDLEDVVRHSLDGRRGLVDRVHRRIVEEALGQLVDAAVKGGREEHPLSVGRRCGQDSGDSGKEAQVGHVVGLVDDGDLDVVETNDALLHQVFESSGACDDDVDAAPERLLLTGLLDATEDRGDGQADGLRQRLDRGGDLCGQLTRRREDEAGGRAGDAVDVELGQSGDQRDRKRKCLTGTRTAAAEDVAAVECGGKGVGLDGESLGFSVRGKDFHDLGRYAELGKCSHVKGLSTCSSALRTTVACAVVAKSRVREVVSPYEVKERWSTPGYVGDPPRELRSTTRWLCLCTPICTPYARSSE